VRYAIIQISKRRFIVAEASVRGAIFRRVCECDTEYGAKQVKDALVAQKGEDHAPAR